MTCQYAENGAISEIGISTPEYRVDRGYQNFLPQNPENSKGIGILYALCFSHIQFVCLKVKIQST